MVNLRTHYLRSTSFAMVVISLIGWIVMMAMLLQRLLRALGVEGITPEKKAYLGRFAYLVGGVLIFSVLLLAVVIIHYVSTRMLNPPERFKPMGYEDAWTEAGRRLKPEDAPPVEPYETGGEEGPDTGDRNGRD